MASEIPKIFKMHDPCAVFKGKEWLLGHFKYPGQHSVQDKGDRAIRFISHAYGINAACQTLLWYQKEKNLKTVKAMISMYAPPSENKTKVYIQRVCEKLGVKPDEQIDVTNEDVMGALIRVIIMIECGPNPPNGLPRNWVSEAEIDKGVQLGLRKYPKPFVPSRPTGFCSVVPLTPQEERDLFVVGVW